jgi:hypothetical protein
MKLLLTQWVTLFLPSNPQRQSPLFRRLQGLRVISYSWTRSPPVAAGPSAGLAVAASSP